jgi:hypothetical protein
MELVSLEEIEKLFFSTVFIKSSTVSLKKNCGHTEMYLFKWWEEHSTSTAWHERCTA